MKPNYNEMYEPALKQPPSALRRALSTVWLLVGLAALIAFAWAEPFSGWLFQAAAKNGVPQWLIDYIGVPLVMGLRGVLLVESAGYGYHRFFQHVGFFSRTVQYLRKNQMFHWLHHMIIYPIGRFYKRPGGYKNSEKGFSWSWVAPAIAVVGLFVLSNGFNLGSLAFLAAFGLYAKYVVDVTHSRFHMSEHSWIDKPYFNHLEQVHVLHHWDQRFNFTIVITLMDKLFGTYMDPAKHQKELKLALEDKELTVSDLINWRYLLLEATPAERAAFISQTGRLPRSLRKVRLLLDVLEARMTSHPDDANARDLHGKIIDLLRACGKPVRP